MEHFDLFVMSWFNQFARVSHVFDALVNDLAYFNLLKGTPFVLALTWLWLSPGEARRRNREIVIATVLGAFVAILLGRLLASWLPMRLRPMSRTDIPFVVPYSVHANGLRSWSAFPSDTAMLFSALATGLWFASWRLGLAMHLVGATVIGLPRLYIGLHHPTDLVAGAAIGIVIGVAVTNERVRSRVASLPLRLYQSYPTAASLVAMVTALQMATMFDDVRALIRDSALVGEVAWCRLSGKSHCDESIGARMYAVDRRSDADMPRPAHEKKPARSLADTDPVPVSKTE